MLLYEELTNEIINAFYEVYNELGGGFLEQVYQNSLYKELRKRGLECEAQRELSVYYKNELVGKYYADIIVEDKVILELKAVSQIRPEHNAQLINYLKATGVKVGIVFNFCSKPEFSRKILS